MKKNWRICPENTGIATNMRRCEIDKKIDRKQCHVWRWRFVWVTSVGCYGRGKEHTRQALAGRWSESRMNRMWRQINVIETENLQMHWNSMERKGKIWGGLGCAVKIGCIQIQWNWVSGKKHHLGWPWWLSRKESACEGRRLGFDPWSGKIPQAKEQLSLSTTAIKPVL